MNSRILVACALGALACNAQASCGSAFCLINTDWSAQGAWTESGGLVDLHYESIDLDKPRHGRDAVGVGEIPRDHDEVRTKNRNWVAAFDWSVAPAWGVSLSIPYVDRDHLHIHHHGDEAIAETWSFRELGDMRVSARHPMFASDDVASPRSWGITFGVKLPTGKHDVANADGEVAERTLQPGTGTTDALVGVYWNGAAPLDGWSWFARAQGVLPMNARADYKPGRQLLLDGGIRYAATPDIGLMLQANYLAKGRDGGEQAEPDDSGQRVLYVSPGASWNATKDAQLYAFVQVPVYQAVNGVQLTASWAAMAGVGWRF